MRNQMRSARHRYLYRRLNARWMSLSWDEQASVVVMLVTLIVCAVILAVLH